MVLQALSYTGIDEQTGCVWVAWELKAEAVQHQLRDDQAVCWSLSTGLHSGLDF